MEELIISAIIGDLASRSISFIIETCSKRMVRPSTVEAKPAYHQPRDAAAAEQDEAGDAQRLLHVGHLQMPSAG
jgi:hypothetical protein